MKETLRAVLQSDKVFHLVLGGLAGFILSSVILGDHHGQVDHHLASSMSVEEERVMSDLSMSGMTLALQGKTGDEFDRAFLTLMIEHHQGAIDMAEEVLKNAKHQELKTLAKAIIEAQSQEITEMKEWHEAWGYEQDLEHVMPDHGMSH